MCNCNIDLLAIRLLTCRAEEIKDISHLASPLAARRVFAASVPAGQTEQMTL